MISFNSIGPARDINTGAAVAVGRIVRYIASVSGPAAGGTNVEADFGVCAYRTIADGAARIGLNTTVVVTRVTVNDNAIGARGDAQANIKISTGIAAKDAAGVLDPDPGGAEIAVGRAINERNVTGAFEPDRRIQRRDAIDGRTAIR